MTRCRWWNAALALLMVGLDGCDNSGGGGRVDEAGPEPVVMALETYVQWSEGSGRLYAVIGAGWPPGGLSRAAWRSAANYAVEPPLAVQDGRLLRDGMTVCLETAEQASGADYRVRFTPSVTFPVSPLYGFPQNPVLTAVAVDSTHLVVVPDSHHLERTDWADAATYQVEPSLAVHSVEVLAGGRLVGLTTAEQDPATPYRVVMGAGSAPIIR